MDKYQRDMLERLLHITRGCRPDMHEPDEQDLKAHVVGTSLDNAFGESIDPRHIERGCQEIVVVLERWVEQHDGRQELIIERFNLASLIALARMAKEEDTNGR